MVTTERVPDCDSPHGRGGAAWWGATKERNDLLDAAAQPEPPHNGCCAQPGAQLTHHNSAPAGIHRPTQQPEGRPAKSNTSNLQPIPMESEKYVRKVMEGGQQHSHRLRRAAARRGTLGCRQPVPIGPAGRGAATVGYVEASATLFNLAKQQKQQEERV